MAVFVEDILVDPPASLPSVPLADHLADATDAHDASAVSTASPLPQANVQASLAAIQAATAVAGSRADPEQALANLLTALASAGIITDGTTP